MVQDQRQIVVTYVPKMRTLLLLLWCLGWLNGACAQSEVTELQERDGAWEQGPPARLLAVIGVGDVPSHVRILFETDAAHDVEVYRVRPRTNVASRDKRCLTDRQTDGQTDR